MIADPVGFIVTVLILTVLPGADMALVSRAALTAGRGALAATIGGIVLGLVAHAVLSIAGISTLLVASPRALSALQVAGALWIGWLGAVALHAALRPPAVAGDASAAAAPLDSDDDVRRWFRRGLVTNLVNVKIVFFYLALLPQFAVGTGAAFVASAMLVAGLQIMIGVAWLSAWGLGTLRVSRGWEPAGRQRRISDAVAGALLLLVAVGLLVR